MKCSCLFPASLAFGLLLSGCGARSSLTTPGVDTDCGPWSVRDGAAGVERRPEGAFAVLDDGSVVLPMNELVRNIDPDPGDFNDTYWARKLDPGGEVTWDSLTQQNEVSIAAVARDAAGGLYVSGKLTAGTSSAMGAKLTCPGKAFCGFVGKLDETGTLGWSKVISSDAVGTGVSAGTLAVTADGRITLAGIFDGTTDFGCGPLTSTPGSGWASGYLVRLSPAGECLWSRALVGTSQIGAPSSLAVDGAGEVGLGLSLRSHDEAWTIDLGQGPMPVDASKRQGLALAKYTGSGDPVFTRVVNAGSVNSWVNVGLTGAGDLLFTTTYGGPLDLGAGPHGAAGTTRHFVTELDAQGHELWTRDIHVEPTMDVNPSLFTLAVDPGGDFILAAPGRPGMTIAGEPTPEKKLFAATYDAGGEPLDVQTFPFTGEAWVQGVDASAADALVFVGNFKGTLDFGQEPLVSQGDQDTFMARFCR